MNEALLAFRHLAVFPWHLRIRLEARHLADQRMPTSEESEILFRVGDRIEAAVVSGRTFRLICAASVLIAVCWPGVSLDPSADLWRG